MRKRLTARIKQGIDALQDTVLENQEQILKELDEIETYLGIHDLGPRAAAEEKEEDWEESVQVEPDDEADVEIANELINLAKALMS